MSDGEKVIRASDKPSQTCTYSPRSDAFSFSVGERKTSRLDLLDRGCSAMVDEFPDPNILIIFPERVSSHIAEKGRMQRHAPSRNCREELVMELTRFENCSAMLLDGNQVRTGDKSPASMSAMRRESRITPELAIRREKIGRGVKGHRSGDEPKVPITSNTNTKLR